MMTLHTQLRVGSSAGSNAVFFAHKEVRPVHIYCSGKSIEKWANLSTIIFGHLID
jgi:hypothetical protein